MDTGNCVVSTHCRS